MSLDKWIIVLRDIMLAMFTLYLFFIYFNIFFKRKKIGISVLIGIITLFVWQFCIPYIIYTLPSVLNIVITLGFTIFASIHIFQGKVWMKGLFSIILSLPDNWKFSNEGLCSLCKESKTAVDNAIKELKNRGYLKLVRRQNSLGKFYYDYEVYENPRT